MLAFVGSLAPPASRIGSGGRVGRIAGDPGFVRAGVGQLISQRAEVRIDSRRQLAQERQDLVAHANAQKARVAVRRIGGERDLVTRNMGVDRRARGIEEGADEVSRARREHCETARPPSHEEGAKGRSRPGRRDGVRWR